MPSAEQDAYDQSKNDYWTYMSTIVMAKKTGHTEGLAEGRAEGLVEGEAKGRTGATLEIARKMKLLGIDAATIAQTTGLPQNEIKRLR
ncbi:MAG: hypothetical protein LBT89_02485, partial [Planctomycetaceae bacterium]|jgi:predicted transposase/invertase (TIGR01784 family)|nr:hypothetical protein [Planctomycetaceae bacterium]